MLKIWKQAWKKEDGAGLDGGQDRNEDASSEAKSSSPVVEHHVLGPIASDTQHVRPPFPQSPKRSHAVLAAQDESDHNRPPKRRRTEKEGPVDNISKHLPEVVDLDARGASFLDSASAISAARQENGSWLFDAS